MGVIMMCDGNHMHIMNILVYCSKRTMFLKSVDVFDVSNRNTNYYFQLLDKVLHEVGEENIVQVVTNNEKALRVVFLKLIKKKEKRMHRYWSACI